jgi:GNAT superfamily N-acetyltransferase
MWLRTSARTDPLEPRIEAELADPEMLTVVGEYEGAGVGIAVAALRSSSDGGRFVQVTDLFTLPDARHVGVGEAMMNFCIDWARSHNAFAIDAAVLPGTRDAKNFFEGFGLTARALTVSLDL